VDASITYQPPSSDIYEFMGVFKSLNNQEPLSLENSLWANTIITSGKVLGLILFSGK